MELVSDPPFMLRMQTNMVLLQVDTCNIYNRVLDHVSWTIRSSHLCLPFHSRRECMLCTMKTCPSSCRFVIAMVPDPELLHALKSGPVCGLHTLFTARRSASLLERAPGPPTHGSRPHLFKRYSLTWIRHQISFAPERTNTCILTQNIAIRT